MKSGVASFWSDDWTGGLISLSALGLEYLGYGSDGRWSNIAAGGNLHGELIEWKDR